MTQIDFSLTPNFTLNLFIPKISKSVAVQTLLPGKPDKSLGCNLRRTRIPSKRAAGGGGGIGRGTNLSSINWRKVQENELPGVCNLIEVS